MYARIGDYGLSSGTSGPVASRDDGAIRQRAHARPDVRRRPPPFYVGILESLTLSTFHFTQKNFLDFKKKGTTQKLQKTESEDRAQQIKRLQCTIPPTRALCDCGVRSQFVVPRFSFLVLNLFTFRISGFQFPPGHWGVTGHHDTSGRYTQNSGVSFTVVMHLF